MSPTNKLIFMKEYQRGLVSICIPAYKRKFLSETISSALSQDYKNIELIIVDDHSPQKLFDIVSPFLSDNRVSYYMNERNYGSESIVLNWNICLQKAKGEFFVLLCDDDLLKPDFVSTLVDLSYKYPTCNVFHGRRSQLYTNKEEEDPEWPEFLSFNSYMLKDNKSHSITEFLYRTSAIAGIGYVVFPLGWCSDNASLIRFIQTGGVVSSRNVLAFFRHSEEHISRKGEKEFIKVKALMQYWTFLLNLRDNPVPIQNRKESFNYLLVSSFNSATFPDKIKMLVYVPLYIWPLKVRCALFIDILLHR